MQNIAATSGFIETDSIPDAIRDLQRGRAIVVLDDHDRENEGDLVFAAQSARPEDINFMARNACGLICVAMTGEALDRLGIPMMVNHENGRSRFGSPFTVSVEASQGVTTGISAADRARTVRVLSCKSSTIADITTPGHVFPLRAHPDGVFSRRGHTEAGVDLMRLAGFEPAAVICEIMNEDGSMARAVQLKEFALEHNLLIITIDELVAFRRNLEDQNLEDGILEERNFEDIVEVSRVDSARLPTRFGEFTVTAYVDATDQEHLVLSMGEDRDSSNPLVRVHSECLTGDVLGSLRCDCGDQLTLALERISKEGSGLVIYLRQEGRGIGLANKIRAYALQDRGMDTVEANLCLGYRADQRDYGIAAAILNDRSIMKIRLMTNNPQKISDLESHGIEISERIALEVQIRPENESYLRTKRDKLNHVFFKES